MTLPDLDSFLSPRSIAIVGASSSPAKIGAVPVRYLVEHGYDGAIYPINARADQIEGRRAYPSLRAVEAPIDLAVFAIPASSVDAALDDAIAAGVKNIVMFSAGFAEMGKEGEQAQAAFAARAKAAGIRVLGPNCLGFMNVARAVYATFSPVVATGANESGCVGIVSQSGAFGAYAYAMARERGLGLSAWITTGNESDIGVADCIAWMARDPATRVIMAYLEGCKDGRKLRDSLDLAQAAGKPVVVVKVGRTELGALTAASHTAALAGDDAVFDALFRQHGAYRARTIEEFFDVAHGLAVAGLPPNKQVGLLTVSGGVGVMMADEAADAALEVTALPVAAQAMIHARVPLAATHNPVDITGQVTAEPDLLEATARIMLGEAGHGSLLIFLAAFGATPAMRILQQQMAQALRNDFPGRLIIFSTLADTAQQRALEAAGCLSFTDPARAVRVMAAMQFFIRQQERVNRPDAETPWSDAFAAMPAPEDASTAPGPLRRGAHNEADALRTLAAHGIPIVPFHRANSRDDVIAGAQSLGFPVAMKVLSADITHKSDVGGVVLNIHDADEAAAAYARILDAARSFAPNARIDGVLVARMVRGGVECILGARRDPALGVVVMLGSGGVTVELLGDVTFRLAPVDIDQARAMVGELKTARLLQGFRGKPPCDVEALAEAIVRLSRFALTAGDSLESVELNPFVVLPAGQGALALDAVLLTAPPATTNASSPALAPSTSF
ncbi:MULTISPECIES: acetate--CoA ligase family protein [Achromobacter]|uniref:Acetate--CoA ligase family protein n=1 Tax=Achromobacter spanius TaxID=217203 RepID=A0ABY8GVY0_9BURK|nr:MULTISPECIES: acetate--CoA ligase family protein [Achromobacter]WAI81736.1 acetate--CoA ligase family protein [Achromobacter spanius]WEX97253.1 acetate--CoA ligase family protein [Achromobacter sp. SS2-2022]WFP09030.1 acetate--CoA ligase family protein [Achromobacter spanius]